MDLKKVGLVVVLLVALAMPLGFSDDWELDIEVSLSPDGTDVIEVDNGTDVFNVTEDDSHLKWYDNDTEISVEAIPDENNKLKDDEWLAIPDECDPSSYSCTFTMNEDEQAYADFEVNETVEVFYGGEGTEGGDIEVEGTVREDGEGLNLEEGTYSLHADPDYGYNFTGWEGDTEHISEYEGDDEGYDYILNVTDESETLNITGVFEVAEVDLRVKPGDNGAVELDNKNTTVEDEQVFTYDYGEEETLEGIPDDGYVFYQWNGDFQSCDSEDSVCTIELNEAEYEMEMEASFEEDTADKNLEGLMFDDPDDFYQDLDRGKDLVPDSEMLSSLFYHPSMTIQDKVHWFDSDGNRLDVSEGIEPDARYEYEYDYIELDSDNVYELGFDRSVEEDITIVMEDTGGWFGFGDWRVELTTGSCSGSEDVCIDEGTPEDGFYFSPEDPVALDNIYIENEGSNSMKISDLEFKSLSETYADPVLRDLRFHSIGVYDSEGLDEYYWETWRKNQYPASVTFDVYDEYGGESVDDLVPRRFTSYQLEDGVQEEWYSNFWPLEEQNWSWMLDDGEYAVTTAKQGQSPLELTKDVDSASYMIELVQDRENMTGEYYHEAVSEEKQVYDSRAIFKDYTVHDKEMKFKATEMYRPFKGSTQFEDVEERDTLEASHDWGDFNKDSPEIDHEGDHFDPYTEFTYDFSDKPEDTRFTVEVKGDETHLTEIFEWNTGWNYIDIEAVTCGDMISGPMTGEQKVTSIVKTADFDQIPWIRATLYLGNETYSMRMDEHVVMEDLNSAGFYAMADLAEKDNYTVEFTFENVSDSCTGDIIYDPDKPYVTPGSLDMETISTTGIDNQHLVNISFQNTDNSQVEDVEVTITPDSRWFLHDVEMENSIRPAFGTDWNEFVHVLGYVLSPDSYEYIVEPEREDWTHEFSGYGENISDRFTSMDIEDKKFADADLYMLGKIPSELDDKLSDTDAAELRKMLEPVEYLLGLQKKGSSKISINYNYTSDEFPEGREVTKDLHAEWTPDQQKVEYQGGIRYPYNKIYTGEIAEDRISSRYSENDPLYWEQYLPWNMIKDSPLVFIMFFFMFVAIAPVYMFLLR